MKESSFFLISKSLKSNAFTNKVLKNQNSKNDWQKDKRWDLQN